MADFRVHFFLRFTMPRSRRSDATMSIVLALVIGLIVGACSWFVITRPDLMRGLPLPAHKPAPQTLPTTAIVPHKALYAIKMISARNGSQIANIGGKMYYQLENTCHQWVTNHRFSLDYEYADSAPMRVTSDFSTSESEDGKSFSFSSRRHRDGELYEQLEGKASTSSSTPGEALYSEPEGLFFELRPGTLFPTAHTAALIRAAQDGKKFLSLPVFDGSDTEGPVDISAVLGGKVTPSDQPKFSAGVDKSLLASPAWSVKLSFFPSQSAEATADYELTMTLHENGVISEMNVDYDDFSVQQSLIALEKIPAKSCTEAVPLPRGR